MTTILTTEPAPKKERTKRVRKTTVEEFNQPIEEPKPVPAEAEPEPGDELNDIDSLLDGLEEEEQEHWTIRVERLPSFHKNGIAFSRTAEVEYCGVIPAHTEYLEIARGEFGPGTYRFILRDANGNWVKKWRRTISAMPATGAPAMYPQTPGAPVKNYFFRGQQQQAGAVPVPEPTSPVDQIKNLREVMTEFAELRKVLGVQDQVGQSAATTPAVVSAEQNAEDKIKNKLLDVALDSVFKSGDEGRIEGVLDRVLGPREAEASWANVAMELMREVLKPLAPVAAQLVAAIVMAKSQGNAASGQVRPTTDLEPGVSDNRPVSTLPAPPQIDPFTRLCRRILRDFNDGYPADVSVTPIEIHLERYQGDAEKIQAILGENTAEVAVSIVSAAGAPAELHTPQLEAFIADLQQALREIITEDENERTAN